MSGEKLKENEYKINAENSTDEEIVEWIALTRKVLIVLDDEDKDAYNRVYQDFLVDLQALNEAGRVTDIDYDEILESL